jgi:hypothetical protein
MGKINLLGLNQFGNPVGMERVWGAAVGTGAGTIGAIAARRLATPGGWASRWSEAVGLLVGAGAGGLMMLKEGTRAAGVMGIVSAALNNGLRLLEQVLFSGGTAGVGWYTTETANPLLAGQMGMYQVNQVNGLGYPTAAPQPHAYGTVPGVAGPMQDNGSPPVNLLGGNINLLGGGSPSIAGLSSMYGATIMGSR